MILPTLRGLLTKSQEDFRIICRISTELRNMETDSAILFYCFTISFVSRNGTRA